MMLNRLIRASFVCFLAIAHLAHAQAPADPLATVGFKFSFPGTMPPNYEVSIDATGKVKYQSSDADKGDSYETNFTATDATRSKVFQLATQLSYFKGDFEYRRSKIANTGAKTLLYKDAQQQNQTSYNWSENVGVQDLTKLFQNLSLTMEYGRRLTFLHRFDKLGVDGELKRMEQSSKDNQLVELHALTSILKDIAADKGIINVARRRAESLLAQATAAGSLGARP